MCQNYSQPFQVFCSGECRDELSYLGLLGGKAVQMDLASMGNANARRLSASLAIVKHECA